MEYAGAPADFAMYGLIDREIVAVLTLTTRIFSTINNGRTSPRISTPEESGKRGCHVSKAQLIDLNRIEAESYEQTVSAKVDELDRMASMS
jgi:hypothetical protein